jgi:hypothetical protein
VAALLLLGAFGSLSLTPLGCRAAGPPTTRQGSDVVVGVKIYEHAGDRAALFASFEGLGINTLFVSEKLAGDPEFRALARQHRGARLRNPADLLRPGCPQGKA